MNRSCTQNPKNLTSDLHLQPAGMTLVQPMHTFLTKIFINPALPSAWPSPGLLPGKCILISFPEDFQGLGLVYPHQVKVYNFQISFCKLNANPETTLFYSTR